MLLEKAAVQGPIVLVDSCDPDNERQSMPAWHLCTPVAILRGIWHPLTCHADPRDSTYSRAVRKEIDSSLLLLWMKMLCAF